MLLLLVSAVQHLDVMVVYNPFPANNLITCKTKQTPKMPRHIYIIDLHNLYDNVNELKLEKPFTNYELITKNTKIPQSLQHTNSNFLLLQEALHMKIEERRAQ